MANKLSPFAERSSSSQNQPLPSECQTCRGRRVKSEDEDEENDENDCDDDYGDDDSDDDVAK